MDILCTRSGYQEDIVKIACLQTVGKRPVPWMGPVNSVEPGNSLQL